MPLPYRWLTALMIRYNGHSVLIDCGEGTQIALREKGWSPKPIDLICLTHFHADHVSGLPGLLLTMGNAERTEPLTIVGPKGLPRLMNAIRVIAPELPFEIRCKELNETQEGFDFEGLHFEAFRVNHNITCYGYSITLPRQGRFQVEKAMELGLERKYWNLLQKGQNVTIEGKEYTPDMVMGEARKGLKLTYTTDTRPTDSIVENAYGSDLFICEGMYGEKDKIAKAKEHKHMTFMEAAEMAKRAEVKEMWLTHYSPALIKAEEFLDDVRKVFPRTYPGKDGKSRELDFEDDE